MTIRNPSRITGTVMREPTLIESNENYCRFDLLDKEGKRHSIYAYGKRAQVVYNMIAKDMKVSVEGQLVERIYSTHKIVKIILDDFEIRAKYVKEADSLSISNQP